ncbi:MAG: pseudouridine synthase [Planctomycetota bacterium]
MKERLHKYLAHCGVASRRECEELIAQGRVEVNGEVRAKPGTTVNPTRDEIKVDGERVRQEKPVYYLVNKPRGYICTNRDEHGRPRVIDLVPEERRIYSVGRLDEDSEGLLLLTNDGTLANVLTHPRYEVDKTYRLLVRGSLPPEAKKKIESGVWLSDGKTAPAHVRRINRKGPNTLVTVTLWEGRNRELRRMFAKVGLRVQSLTRTAIGPLRLEDMPSGAWRRVPARELAFATARLKPNWKPTAKKNARAPRRT